MLDLNRWLEKQICESKTTYKNPYININEVPTRNKNVREIKLISCMKKMHSSDKQNNTDDNKDYKNKSKNKNKTKNKNKSNMNNRGNMNKTSKMSKTSKMIKMIKMIKMNSLETKTSEMKQNNLKCFWEAKYHKIKFIKSCKKRNTVKQNFERAAYINSTTSDLKDSVSNLEEMMKRFNSKYINETIKEKILESSNSIRKNKLNLKLKLFNEIVKNLYLKPNSNFNFNTNPKSNPNLKSNPNPNSNSTNFNLNVNSNSNTNSNSNSKYTCEKVMSNKSSYTNLMNYFKSNKSLKDLKIFNSIKSLNRLHLYKEKKLNPINSINSINTINSLNVLNPEYHPNQVIYENIFKNQAKNIPINLFTPSNESQRYSYDGSKNYINNINNVNHMNQNCIFENTINGSNRNFIVDKNGQNGKYPVIDNIFGYKTFYSSHHKRKLNPDLIDPNKNLIKKYNQKLCLETSILKKPECSTSSNYSFSNLRLNKQESNSTIPTNAQIPKINSAAENYKNIFQIISKSKDFINNEDSINNNAFAKKFINPQKSINSKKIINLKNSPNSQNLDNFKGNLNNKVESRINNIFKSRKSNHPRFSLTLHDVKDIHYYINSS